MMGARGARDADNTKKMPRRIIRVEINSTVDHRVYRYICFCDKHVKDLTTENIAILQMWNNKLSLNDKKYLKKILEILIIYIFSLLYISYKRIILLSTMHKKLWRDDIKIALWLHQRVRDAISLHSHRWMHATNEHARTRARIRAMSCRVPVAAG